MVSLNKEKRVFLAIVWNMESWFLAPGRVDVGIWPL